PGGLVPSGFSPDGKWLLAGGRKGGVWGVSTWEEGPAIGKEGGFAFSPDGKLLAVCDDHIAAGVIRLIEPTTGREYVRLDTPEQTRFGPACFTPNGNRLIGV